MRFSRGRDAACILLYSAPNGACDLRASIVAQPVRLPRAGASDSMGRRLYVGNLPYSATEDQLTEMFSRAGKVDSVRVMRDMATGRARGFAFVEMGTDEEAQKAISEFHEQQMEGRALVVNEARPKPEGGFGGGGGRPGGGGYRGGGGGGNRSFDDGDFSGGRRKEPRW
jgi:RNA recognition motif-containing protein